jgi:hypothetical protein
LVSERVQLVGDRRSAEDRSEKVLVDPEFLMVGERRREHLGGGGIQEIDKIRWSDRLGRASADAETPEEAELRIALDASSSDAIVVGRRTIAVEVDMDAICPGRGVDGGETRSRSQQD